MKIAAILFGLVLIGFALLFVLRNLPERSAPVGQVTGAPIQASDVMLLVAGWSDAELQTILADFGSMYALPDDTFRTISAGGERFQIDTTGPIGSDVLLYLVNYLHYPKDLNLQGRQLAAVAVLDRSEDIGGPADLAGRRAEIYVPADDSEFDEVFVRIDSKHFRVSFNRLEWRPVDGGRETKGMRELLRGAPTGAGSGATE